jgi:serine phosphatase RsbU (regulator of sigma subunit)
LASTVCLEDLVERLSAFAVDVRGARFSTVVMADYDPCDGRLRVVSAGHVPPMIRRSDASVDQLPDGGPPLGIDVGGGRKVVERVLLPGDTLVMYSDGLVERRGESIDVGFGRLASALSSAGAGPGQALVEALFEALGRPGADDVAVLALGRASVGR